MLARWSRARHCFDGSDAVKAAGTAYLPMLDSHKQKLATGGMEKYDEYRMRALFYNAVGRTVEGMAGALFQTAPQIAAPSTIEADLSDVTMSGVSAEGFGLEVVREVLLTGRYGILIDMPKALAPGEVEVLGSEDVIRPYWSGYPAESIYSWRTERRRGDEILSRVVLCESVEEQDLKDPFVLYDVEQYRVLELLDGIYTQTLWRRIPNSDRYAIYSPTIAPTRRGETLSFIPFSFVGPTSTSTKVQKPPLDDLVIVNLSHYRTMADLEHGRHLTALPTPWVSGALGGSKGAPLFIGSGMAWSLEKDGRAGMLEFTGSGLGHLAEAEREKRKMMATLGARLLEDSPQVQETATAVGMRHAGEQASLRTIAQTSETALTQMLQTHAWWAGTEAKPKDLDDVVYQVNKDFFKVRMAPDELRALITALQSETISYETFYSQLVRGELARPGISDEQELEDIQERSGQFGFSAGSSGSADPNAQDPNAPPDPTLGEEPGDVKVAEGDWWKILQRKKKFVLIDSTTGETLGEFPSQKEAQAEVTRLEEQG